VVREVARGLAGQTAVVQVNTEENPLLAQRFGIRGIPAILIIRQGRVLDSLSGSRDKNSLIAWFHRVVRQQR
jgi:thioredoxin 2